MGNILNRLFRKENWMEIDSQVALSDAVKRYGVLPFFPNIVKGFSIEEMAAPGMLFGGNSGMEGCWEWKGPVIQEMTSGYGKFFKRKAGFVSLELLPDFLNYRRGEYTIRPDSTEALILEMIQANEGLTSTELRKEILGPPRRKKYDEEGFEIERPSRSSLEGPLQRLQMGGYILIADFQYKYTKRGDKYGWGVALYSTPEIWFGNDLKMPDRSPEESFWRMVKEVNSRLPEGNRKLVAKLLE